MRLKRPLVIVPAAIAILALAAVALLWIGAQTPMARRAVAGMVTDATGLPATVGSLRLGLIPRPALEIGGLAIAQPPGFGPAPLLQIERVRVSVPWASLFGRPAVHALGISEATARLVVVPDGTANWSHFFAEPAVGDAEVEEPAPWSLGELELERGTLEVEDRSAHSRWRLTAITLSARNVAPVAAFPVALRFGGVFGANTLHYALEGEARIEPEQGRYEATGLEFRGWAGGDPMPLAGVELTGVMKRASFEIATGLATLEGGRFTLAGVPATLDGTLDFDAPELEADIRIETGVFAPRAPAIAFGFPLPATADPEAFQAVKLTVRGLLREGGLHLDPIRGRLDDTMFSGRAVPGDRLVRATLDRIDVNRYLSAESSGQSTGQNKATLEAAVAQLAALDIDAEIRIADARVGGARVRDAVIRIERDGATP